MGNLTVGLIPSPDLPAELTSKFVDDLPTILQDNVDKFVTWKLEMIIDPLVGSAEYMNELMNKAIKLKNKYNWDFVICITDLPHFMERQIVIADVNIRNHVALISLPSFGFFPMKHRIKRSICTIVNDMYKTEQKLNTPQPNLIGLQRYKVKNKKLRHSPVSRIILHTEKESSTENKREENQQDNEDERTQEDTEKNSDIRYIIKSKHFGQIRILAGMTFANRPWTALISFKKVLMFAFGTGIYITIFPTPWELSTIYSIPRFILLMFAANSAMVMWIIFAHQLWEKPTQKGDVRLRKLYNYTTITTLSVIVLINYLVLFCLFLATIGIFVPPSLFEAGTGLHETPSFTYYIFLTWLITSLGTLAGAIGTISENEEKIRLITYSYRQMNRYYEIQDKENHKESQDDKGNKSQSEETKFSQKID